MGQPRGPKAHGTARHRPHGVRSKGAEEPALKQRRSYGTDVRLGNILAAPPLAYIHFGFIVAPWEGGDLLPTLEDVMIYADKQRRFDALPPPAERRR